MDQILLSAAAVAIYCVVQIVRDFRRRNYVMAGIGLACLAALLTAPIQTHAVKLDMPTGGYTD